MIVPFILLLWLCRAHLVQSGGVAQLQAYYSVFPVYYLFEVEGLLNARTRQGLVVSLLSAVNFPNCDVRLCRWLLL